MPELVRFIAVNYCTAAAVAVFVESLLSQDSDAWTLTIVDNSDDRGELRRLTEIAAGCDRIEVRAAHGNLGYFGAAHWVTSRPGDKVALWTVVSNVDVRIPDVNLVRRLLTEDFEAEVLAPSVVGMPGTVRLNPYLVTRPTARWMWRRQAIFARPLLGQLFMFGSRVRATLRQVMADSAEPVIGRREIFAPHGSFIPFHRRFFEVGGTLEHPVFLFNEEVNVGEQCRLLGLRVVFDPSLRVIHDMHGSTGTWRSRRMLNAQAEAASYGYRLIAEGPDALSARVK